MSHGECSDSSGKEIDTHLVGESCNNKNCLLVEQSYKLAGFKFGLLGDLLEKESMQF
jgi:hypothetical protein